MTEAIYGSLSQIGKKDFDYTIASEIGGPNGLQALLTASEMGKMTVDADLIGRAWPKIYMTVLSTKGMPILPASIADGDGTVVVRVTMAM
jgi:DUF917 family protein